MSISPARCDSSRAVEEGSTFRLLDLPRELRDGVYHHAYVPSSAALTVDESADRAKTQQANSSPHLLGPLYAVSRQIHIELDEHLARLPDETATIQRVMDGDLSGLEEAITMSTRCPKVTSVFVQAITSLSYVDDDDLAISQEFLAAVYLARKKGTQVQTLTFNHSTEGDFRSQPCVGSAQDIKITVNVQTLEISELSGSLAPFLKKDFVRAVEAFQTLVLVDQPR